MFAGSDEVFLNISNGTTTHHIQGLSDISFTHQNQESYNLLLISGANASIRALGSPPSIECSFSKPYINSTEEIPTGVSNLSGEFIYGTGVLGFSDACVSNINISVSEGSVPMVSYDLYIHGDIEPSVRTGNDTSASTGNTYQNDYPTGALGATGITLTADFSTALQQSEKADVQNFDYNVSFDFRPTYEIESIKSSSVRFVNPAVVTVDATVTPRSQVFESTTGTINDYNYNMSETVTLDSQYGQSIESKIVPSRAGKRTISLSLYIGSGDAQTFSVPEAILQSQSLQTSVGGVTTANVSYKGFMFAPY